MVVEGAATSARELGTPLTTHTVIVEGVVVTGAALGIVEEEALGNYLVRIHALADL